MCKAVSACLRAKCGCGARAPHDAGLGVAASVCVSVNTRAFCSWLLAFVVGCSYRRIIWPFRENNHSAKEVYAGKFQL